MRPTAEWRLTMFTIFTIVSYIFLFFLLSKIKSYYIIRVIQSESAEFFFRFYIIANDDYLWKYIDSRHHNIIIYHTRVTMKERRILLFIYIYIHEWFAGYLIVYY